MATLFEVLFHANTSEIEKGSEKVKQLGKDADITSGATKSLGEAFSKSGGLIGEASKIANEFGETIKKMLEPLQSLAVLSSAGAGSVALMGAAFVAVSSAAIIAAAALGAVGLAMALKYVETIEHVNNLGIAFGLTASEALMMSEAATKAGGSLEAIEAIYLKVAKAAVSAKDPLKGTGAAFDTLGISVKDTNDQLKSSENITNEAILAWENGSKTTADMAAMTAILGKKWESNLPAMLATAEAQKIANELAKEGIGISQESTKITEEHTKAEITWHQILGDVGSRLVEIVIPSITSMTTSMTKSYKEGGLVRDIFIAIEKASVGMVVALTVVKGIFELIGYFVDVTMKTLVAFAKVMDDLSSRKTWGNLKKDWEDYKNSVSKGTDELIRAFAKLRDERVGASKSSEQKKWKNCCCGWTFKCKSYWRRSRK